MATTRAMIERRRASRVTIRIPVTVFRQEANGQTAEITAVAVGVSRCGALLRVPFSPEIGSRLLVQNNLSQEVREFRVIRLGETKRDGLREIGVEILHPTRNFWGIRFPDDRAEDRAAELEVHQFPRA